MSDTTPELLIPKHQPCNSKADLERWVKDHTGLQIPTTPVCRHHQAPFDYLWTSYHEPAADLVVWAPRGGGKTRLAALATLLDLLHKPGVGVRILGGSMAQSLRLWEHLVNDGEAHIEQLQKKIKRGRLRLDNASHCEAIPHSQRSVRGMHIQKLRCDELEMFDPQVFEAAKLTTRSMKLEDGSTVKGVIECLSTLHQPWGLMNQVVEESERIGRRVFKWCILDVLEKCPPERECKTCPLHPECQGVLKERGNGFVPIDDAIDKKARVSKETWEAEMLCRMPSTRGAVFPTFDPAVHVVDREVTGNRSLAIDFGFQAPFVCLWIAEDHGQVYVFDEYLQARQTLRKNLKAVGERQWGTIKHVACDPAGNARNAQSGASDKQILQQHGYTVRTAGSHIIDGLELIRTGLQTGTGDVSLFIHPRCQQLIQALQSYHYPPVGQDERPEKDGVFDHPIDALRYFYINRASRQMRTAEWRDY